MPKSKIPAAGEAAPSADPGCLLDITNEIDGVRQLIEVASLACNSIGQSGHAIDAVLYIAQDKLTAARDALDELRGMPGDPALIAITAFKAADKALQEGPGDDKKSSPFWNAREDAIQALGTVSPTTNKGAAELLSVMIEHEGDFFEDDNSPLISAVRNVAAVLAKNL